MPSNPRDLMRRLAQREREFRTRDFLAPYTRESKSVIVKMDGVNYRFNIVNRSHRVGGGIGIFHPVDPNTARYEQEADDDVRRKYLDMLPHATLILCYETELGWIAYPANVASAKKKMGIEDKVLVKNVTDAEVFDAVLVRFDGVHLWYDQLSPSGNAIKSAEIRDCFVPDHSEDRMIQNFENLKGITPEDRKSFGLALESWKVYRKGLTEERLKEMLAIGGGKLGSYVVRGDNIEINWNSKSGQSYTSMVEKENFNVVSAGICLDPHDGTGPQDRRFHLKDLPFIMADGERMHRIVRRHIDMH